MSIEHAVGLGAAVGVGVDGITAVGVMVGATAVITVEEGGVSTAVAVAVGDGVLVGGMGVFVGVFGIAKVGGGVGDSFI
jgi:hypothetical protein